MSYYMEVSSCPTLPLSWVPNCPVPNCPVSKCPVPSCPVSSCPGFVIYRCSYRGVARIFFFGGGGGGGGGGAEICQRS